MTKWSRSSALLSSLALMTLNYPGENGCRIACQIDIITQRLSEACLFLSWPGSIRSAGPAVLFVTLNVSPAGVS
ncbi:hypothetical protein LY78DRAFT_656805 [Colletotrichum sublineola]|nr:hypothetical protein LY78DRAFT_656805 [Colletotrichum sublineola]